MTVTEVLTGTDMGRPLLAPVPTLDDLPAYTERARQGPLATVGDRFGRLVSVQIVVFARMFVPAGGVPRCPGCVLLCTASPGGIAA